jgi:hypothetical protein
MSICNFKLLSLSDLVVLTEEAEKPADLSDRIIFKVKKKKDDQPKDSSEQDTPTASTKPEKKSRKSRKPTKSLLSFNEEEDCD